jgi:hypothetical protein
MIAHGRAEIGHMKIKRWFNPIAGLHIDLEFILEVEGVLKSVHI